MNTAVEQLIFKDLPMPPSENTCYPTFINRRTGKMRRISSKALTTFKGAVTYWEMKNAFYTRFVRDYIEARMTPGTLIRLNLKFYVTHSTVFTKKMQRKRWDVSNRVKPIADAISEILKIDDRFFTNSVDLFLTDKNERVDCSFTIEEL